eukprot:CAMPEP_0204609232 /NCGR_PEP_ID=MMETSP0661-20131031/60794_1 /ASSEMBLY_ACC=CAM_ASM_000606 /TAXON_ID=109239 /ORGANISM="Alexandrium margalefi, Strain AMGDE01CS-322" /LENGTH=44 /DNA_ID= /DNA_START= /DNA_END= /DNA_ORIENTATION=
MPSSKFTWGAKPSSRDATVWSALVRGTSPIWSGSWLMMAFLPTC